MEDGLELTRLELLVGNVVYDLTSEFIHLGNDGLGLPAVRRLEEAGPLQDGATDLGYRLEPRSIRLLLMLTAEDRADYYAKRRRLMEIFRPRREPARLRISLPDGEVREILVHYAGDLSLASADKRGLTHKVAVSLRAADPTFYGPEVVVHTYNASTSGGAFTVPLVVPLKVGSALLDMSEPPVVYEGDWETSPLFTLDGPLEAPIIESLTPEGAVRYRLSLPGLAISPGARVTINTAYGDPYVRDAAGNSLLRYLSDDSDLTGFLLHPAPDAPDGINRLRVRGQAAGVGTRVFVSYRPRYIGL